MEEKDLYWAAGIIEGEGCFTYCNRQIQIQVKMTDQDIIIRLKDIFNLGQVYGPYNHGVGRKPYWRWCVGNYNDTIKIMQLIYPIMGNRRQKKINELIKINEDRLSKKHTPCSKYSWDKLLGHI